MDGMDKDMDGMDKDMDGGMAELGKEPRMIVL